MKLLLTVCVASQMFLPLLACPMHMPESGLPSCIVAKSTRARLKLPQALQPAFCADLVAFCHSSAGRDSSCLKLGSIAPAYKHLAVPCPAVPRPPTSAT